MKNLHNLFAREIVKLFYFERQLLFEYPNIIKATKHPILREAFHSHYEDTKNQFKRIERICEILNVKPTEETYQNIKGLMVDFYNLAGKEISGNVIDTEILSCFKKIKHYEIAIYAVAIGYSKTLEANNITELLEVTVREEHLVKGKLNIIANKYFYIGERANYSNLLLS